MIWIFLAGLQPAHFERNVRLIAPQKLRQIIPKITITISAALSVYEPDAAGQGSERGTTQALTPAQAELRRMVMDAVASPHTRRNYGKALDDLFILSAGRPLSRALLMEY